MLHHIKSYDGGGGGDDNVLERTKQQREKSNVNDDDDEDDDEQQQRIEFVIKEIPNSVCHNKRANDLHFAQIDVWKMCMCVCAIHGGSATSNRNMMRENVPLSATNKHRKYHLWN